MKQEDYFVRIIHVEAKDILRETRTSEGKSAIKVGMYKYILVYQSTKLKVSSFMGKTTSMIICNFLLKIEQEWESHKKITKSFMDF